jgi:ketosteroid isomerase-like protein
VQYIEVMTKHQLIETYFQTLNARDWIGFLATLHEQVLYEVPQTRERVRGREAYLDFNVTFPGDWTLELVRLVADELRGAAEIVLRVDGQVLSALVFFEFADGLISRITDYWPEPYEPPVRVCRFVERI